MASCSEIGQMPSGCHVSLTLAGDLFDRLGLMEGRRDGQEEPEAKRQRVLVAAETGDQPGFPV